jgi:YceI-like domain/NADP oxidoreductase coenzyme F420-dependent
MDPADRNRVGIIGAGRLGQAMARTALRAGRAVVIANSRGPGSLTAVVSALGTGAAAGTVAQASAAGIVGIAVPWARVPEAVQGLEWNGQIVIDATNDLRSANFFETDTYPTMTFGSVGIGHGEDGFDLDGELTLHGVTRPVTLALDVNGFTRDPYGGTRAGFSATTELDRGAYGISTNIPMDGGGVVIGDRIQVFLELQAVLNPPQPANP